VSNPGVQSLPMDSPPILGRQVKAARALLSWTQLDLAKVSGVSEKTIVDFEDGKTKPQYNTTVKLRTALSGAGIEFQNDDGGIGVLQRSQ
jgi:DNA-binding XRE family transcriptional regulator